MLIGFKDATGAEIPFDQIERVGKWTMPLPLMKGLARQRRRYADITATELVGPPQIRLLKKRHDYFIAPAKLIWASFGTGMHKMLELNSEANALVEEKLVVEFSVRLSDDTVRVVRLGGTSDHYTDSGEDHYTEAAEDGVLTNYKCTSTYKAKMLHAQGPDSSPEWVAAENVYAFLWRRQGFLVNKLQLCLLLRNWSDRELSDATNKFWCMECSQNHMRDSRPGLAHSAFEDTNKVIWYPPEQFYMHELPVWPDEQVELYILDRLALHLNAEFVPDEQLPECTAEEHWNGRRCQSYCEVSHLCCQRSLAVQLENSILKMKGKSHVA